MTCLFRRYLNTTIQYQLVNKQGRSLCLSRTRHRPVGDLFGRAARGIGIGFAGGLGVLVLTLIFQIKPGAIPLTLSKSSWRLLPLLRPCRWRAVWTTVSWRAHAAPPSEIHHLPCPLVTVYDHSRGNRPHGVLHAAGDHRGGKEQGFARLVHFLLPWWRRRLRSPRRQSQPP